MDHFLFTNTQKIKSIWNLQDGSVHKTFLVQVLAMQKEFVFCFIWQRWL